MIFVVFHFKQKLFFAITLRLEGYTLDLGPQAGDEGGNLVFAGLPEDLANNRESYTAKYLKDKLS